SYDKDGAYIASSDSAGTIYVWEAESGKNVFKRSAGFDEAGYAQHVTCVQSFGDRVAWVTGDGIAVYNFEGKELLNESLGYVSYAKSTADKGYVAIVADSRLVVYDINKLTKVAEFDQPTEDLSLSRIQGISETRDSVVLSLYQRDETAEGAVCAAASISDGSLVQVKTEENYLVDGHLTNDGNLITISCNEDSLLDMEDVLCKVECFSLQSAEPQKLWVQDLTFSYLETQNNRIFTLSGTGDSNSYVMVAGGSNVYSFDPQNGEIFYKTGLTGGVKEAWLNTNGFLIVATADGTLSIINAETGENYTSNAVKVNRTIQDAILKNGRVATRASYDSDIVLMGYITPACLIEKKSLEESINDIQYTEDGSLLALINNNDYGNVKVDFYDTKDDSLKDSVTFENDGVYRFAGFLNNDRFALIDRKGKLSVYTLSSKKTETADPGDIGIVLGFDISKDRRYALLMLSRGAVVYDLENLKVTASEFEDTKLEFLVISADGSCAYGFDSENRFFRLDFETNTFDYDFPEITVPVSTTDRESYIAVSEDGKLVGICSRDGFFRVLDVETKTVVHEIPFKCNSYAFTEFGREGQLVYLQGNDY
ncbi:MAG: PQQ-binding-like beta-propeller repeat protein, partial [Parasporobacterium sp.]|nr:PQQ-binding-like beta-propeller repeat protein [Parasporobacterium sp.]